MTQLRLPRFSGDLDSKAEIVNGASIISIEYKTQTLSLAPSKKLNLLTMRERRTPLFQEEGEGVEIRSHTNSAMVHAKEKTFTPIGGISPIEYEKSVTIKFA